PVDAGVVDVHEPLRDVRPVRLRPREEPLQLLDVGRVLVQRDHRTTTSFAGARTLMSANASRSASSWKIARPVSPRRRRTSRIPIAPRLSRSWSRQALIRFTTRWVPPR